MNTTQYDIALTGAGMASLSLAYRAIKSGVWNNKSVVIFDNVTKRTNDKTWCFWQKNPSPYEEIIYCKWDEMLFFDNSGNKYKLETGSYTYNMIRSIDFYNHTIDFLNQQKNVTFISSKVESISNYDNEVIILANSRKCIAKTVFNSIYKKPKLKNSNTYLLQHFKGIVIESDNIELNHKQIHLMDFRTGQEFGNAFFYVLPTSTSTALIEYTLFSEELLPKEIYGKRIKEYISEILQIKEYSIIRDEFGIIPMTDFKFDRFDGNIVNIGSAGGDTRGSTGYTFNNVQKTVSSIIDNYKKYNNPFFKMENISSKHRLYDSTLLKVLSSREYKGHQLFTDMFTKVPTTDIFSFLDSESSLNQDLKVISSLKPTYFIAPFIKSLIF